MIGPSGKGQPAPEPSHITERARALARNYLAPQHQMHHPFTRSRECHLPAAIAGTVGDVGEMLYQAYQAHTDIMVPVRNWAGTALRALGQPLSGVADNAVLRNLTAAYELMARAGLTHARP